MTTKLTSQEANAQIAEHVRIAYAELAKAEALADEYDMSFSFDVEYGMGGTYQGGEWTSSSDNC